MSAVSKAWAHLVKEFRSLTAAARVTAALLLALVVVSLGLLVHQQASEPDRYLLNGQAVAEGQMPVFEAAFAKAGLSDYEVEGSRVRIPRGRNSFYMAALADAGALPANFGSYFDQMIKQTGPFMNRAQQEEMIKVARQHELALIIQSMKGVERAAVLYDTQKKSGLHGGEIVTASVNVKLSGNLALEREQVESLRNLLAGAIAGLDPRNVAVTDLGSGRTYYANADDGMDDTDSYVSRKREYERMWCEKLRQSLEMIPKVIVTVNVELDPEVIDEQTTVEFDKPAPHGGSVGPLADALAFARQESAGAKEDAATPGTRRTTVHKVPLRPLRATVAIGIPSSYIEQVWRHQHAATASDAARPDPKALAALQADIINKVEAHVKSLLPEDGEKTGSRLSVTATVFQDMAEKEAVAEPDAWTLLLEWTGRHESLLAIGALAVFGMLMLQSLVPLAPVKTSKTKTPLATETVAIESNAAGSDADAPPDSKPRESNLMGTQRVDAAATGPPTPAALIPDDMSSATGPSQAPTAVRTSNPPAAESQWPREAAAKSTAQDQLASMVRDDPDAAATILRNWIGSAR